MPNAPTLDDLFAGVASTPHLARTRKQLEYANVDDVDKLCTFSMAELAGRFSSFGPKTQMLYRERLRLFGRALGDNALPMHVRCAAVYGVQTMPLEQVSIHSTNSRQQALIQLILRYAPDTTLGQFDGWYEDDVHQLVGILFDEQGDQHPYLHLRHNEVQNLIYTIEEWGQVSIHSRQPQLVVA